MLNNTEGASTASTADSIRNFGIFKHGRSLRFSSFSLLFLYLRLLLPSIDGYSLSLPSNLINYPPYLFAILPASLA